MKRYKITKENNRDEFHYLSEASAKIFENNQIKNNQSFIRIKTLQDKEINILPSEWRIKYDGEYQQEITANVSDQDLKSGYERYSKVKTTTHPTGLKIFMEDRLGLDIGAYKIINGCLVIVDVVKYQNVKVFIDYFQKRNYAEAQASGNIRETLPKLTENMI